MCTPLELQFQVLKLSDEKVSDDMKTFIDTILRKVDTRLHTQLQFFQVSLTAAIQKSVEETIRKELQIHMSALIYKAIFINLIMNSQGNLGMLSSYIDNACRSFGLCLG